MADELTTNINITADAPAIGPLNQLTSAEEQAYSATEKLGQAMHEMAAASRSGADALQTWRAGVQQTAQAADSAAQAMQRAHQAASGGGAGGGGGGGGGAAAGGGFWDELRRGMGAARTEAQGLPGVFQNVASGIRLPFQALGSAAQGVQGAVRGVGDALNSAIGPILQGAGFALAIAGINGIGGALQGVAGAAIGFNSQLQLTGIALTSFTHDATLAQDEIKVLQNIAQTTPFEFQDLLTGARRFQSLGIEAGKVVTIMQDLGVVGASFGLDPNQFNRVTLALEQVGVKGHLTGEELRQLGNDGFQAMRILEVSTGHSMSQIQADISAGTISAAQFFKAIHDYAQQKDLQDLAKSMGDSFAVQSSNLHDILQQLVSGAFEPFFRGVSQGLSGLNAALMTPAVRQFGADFAATLQDIGTHLAPMNALFVQAFSFLEKGDVGRALQTGLSAIGEGIRDFTTTMFGAGENLMVTFAQGIVSGAVNAIRGAAEFAAQLVADVLVGQSPPKSGPLQSIDHGGLAVGQAWIQGFMQADLGAAASSQAQAVRDALGNVQGTLSLEAGRSALQQAGQDVDRLKAVSEAAAGAQRTLGDELRNNQSEANRLAGEAEGVKRGYEDQLEPLERALQNLRDQGDQESKLYDIARRRRELTFGIQERQLQGDPVRRAELQNDLDSLAAQEKTLQLRERQVALDATGAKGKDADQAHEREAAIRQQILEIDLKRAGIQQQMDGLVDREGLARLKVQEAQAKQTDDAHDLQKAQDDYNKSVEENNLTQQIHGLKQAEEDALTPLERRRKELQDQAQQLQQENALWGQLKSDASEMLQAVNALAAEEKRRNQEAKTARADAAKAAGDAGMGLAGLPSFDIKARAAELGTTAGESLLGGMQAKLSEIGPRVVAAGLGAAVGGAVFGPLGVVAGGLFGDSFFTSLQAKVPNVSTIAADALRTFQQALQGDWSPPGVDAWVNPFVTHVGEAGTAIHTFAADFTREWNTINAGGAVTDALKSLATLFGDLAGALLYTGRSSDTASPQISAAGSAGKTLADGFKGTAQFIKEVSDAVDTLAKGIKPVVDALNFLQNLQHEQAQAAQQRNAGIAQAIMGGAPQLVAPTPKPSQDLKGPALEQYGAYVEGAEEALAPLQTVVQTAVDDAAAETPALAAAVQAQQPPMQQAANGLGLELHDSFTAQVTTTQADLTAAVPNLPAAVQGQQAPMQAAALSVGTALQTPLSAATAGAVSDAQDTLPDFPAAVVAQQSPVQTAASVMADRLHQPIQQGIADTVELAQQDLPGIPQAVKDQQATMRADAGGLADELHAGFQTGFDRGKPVTTKNIGDFFNDLVAGVKSALGIQSPSTVFAGLAEESWAGYQGAFLKSIQSGQNPILEAVGGLVNKVRDELSKLNPFQGGAGGDVPNFARQAAAQFGIDPETFVRQLQAENNFGTNIDPNSKGARGVAQFIPSTAEQAARELGVTTQEFWASWQLQVQGAARLMRDYIDQYGNEFDALVAYNAGPGAVGNPIPETVDYARRIIGNVPRGPADQTGAQGAFLPIDLRTTQAQGALSQAEASSRCGPFAAQLFAQAVGRNPTAQEADELAAGFGWRPGVGMTSAAAWPDMAQALINRAGGGARVQEIPQGQAAAAAMSGAPVAFNTPDHYFVAQGYNPQTQQFHVGSTGTFAGGSEWMTVGQIAALGGQITHVYTEISTAAGTAATSQGTLGQQSRLAAQGLQAATPPAQVFATALDALYNSVANGRTPLATLQTQLVEIEARAGAEGAAGALDGLVNGTDTAAHSLELVATAAAKTNPAIAALVNSYKAAGGAASANEEDTAKFALDLLNVMKAAEGQSIEGAKAVGGASAAAVAAPLAAINNQVDQGNDIVPRLGDNWQNTGQKASDYAQVDLGNARVEEAIRVVGRLADAWDGARNKVEDYIKKLDDAIKEQRDSGISFQHGGTMPTTGLATIHAGERILPAGPNGWTMGSSTINLTINGDLGPSARARRTGNEMLYELEQRRAADRRAAFGSF